MGNFAGERENFVSHVPASLHEEVISVTFGLRSVVVICETQTESKRAESFEGASVLMGVSCGDSKSGIWFWFSGHFMPL